MSPKPGAASSLALLPVAPPDRVAPAVADRVAGQQPKRLTKINHVAVLRLQQGHRSAVQAALFNAPQPPFAEASSATPGYARQ